MPNPLPVFPYHADPLTTGSVEPSDAKCRSCNQERGFIYVGPVYAEEELNEALCPWCIADGSAAAKFSAEFVDPEGVGGYGAWESVPSAAVEQVCRRTPGFNAWQQEQWWTHCKDAAEFLGPAGRAELEEKWQSAIPGIQEASGYDDDEWEEYFAALDRDAAPTAYVFRCRHCGQLGGYSDMT